MIKVLIKKFIFDYENISDKNVREKYGVLSGTLGILCNLFLFALKLIIGLIMNSIAIISDAFNNLSDNIDNSSFIFGSLTISFNSFIILIYFLIAKSIGSNFLKVLF